MTEAQNAELVRCMQVITVADFHPIECHTFAFATSKGAIRLADLRASALADSACKSFEEVRGQLSEGAACMCMLRQKESAIGHLASMPSLAAVLLEARQCLWTPSA